MRKITLFALAACTLLAAGCNTVSGVGRDVSSAGKAVARTADDVKR